MNLRVTRQMPKYWFLSVVPYFSSDLIEMSIIAICEHFIPSDLELSRTKLDLKYILPMLLPASHLQSVC